MTHTYKITGMTCNNCVKKVKDALEGIQGIEKADVTLDPPEAVITMGHHIQTSDMNNILSAAGSYSLKELNGEHHNTSYTATQEDEKKSFWTAYKPILLVFAYLLGASILNEIHNGSFNLMRFMQIFMGGFFLVFSFFKLLDLKGFAYSYMSYDIIAKQWLGWGFIYPFVELVLGLAYLFHFEPAVTHIVTIAVMSVSSIGVIQSLLNKRKIQCACLGTVFNLPMSNITLIEDLLMILMAAASLVI
jgi:copper chaperone CopZ